ncbi:MAG: AMP-binding protein [Chlorobi bacterium]|nr:AMP-binding protein [Chlorobiota bacterium]
MSAVPSIHPAFRLAGRSFKHPADLLTYVEMYAPAHAPFLYDWFSDSPTVRLHTSGSTGKPSVHIFAKDQLTASARRTADYFRAGAGTGALHVLDPSFVAGKMMWVRALVAGWDLHLAPPGGPWPERRFDFAAMVPRQARKFASRLEDFGVLLWGGAPVDPPLARLAEKIPGAVFQTFGMTETLTHVAVMPLNRTASQWCGCTPGLFHLLPGVTARTDPEGRLYVEDRITGIRARTNDLVEIKGERSFRWLGRADDVINTGGIKVHPAAVEAKLAPYFSSRFMIGALPDARWGQKIVLVIENSPFELPSDLYERAGLAYYEKPKEVFFLPRFPLTPSGKIRRNEVMRAVRAERR